MNFIKYVIFSGSHFSTDLLLYCLALEKTTNMYFTSNLKIFKPIMFYIKNIDLGKITFIAI